MKRIHLFTLLLCFTSCAEILHAGTWFFGKWIIKRPIQTAQGIYALTDTQVKSFINQTVELSSVVAKSGGEEIGDPQYRTNTVTRFDFYGEEFKHVDPAELGINSDPVIIIEVTDANNKEWTHVGGTLIVKDVDTLITIWDGVFFEMKRAESTKKTPFKTQPSHQAVRYRKQTLFKSSCNRKGYLYHFLNRACAFEDEIGVRILLEQGADVNGNDYLSSPDYEKGIEFSSPLLVAVMTGNIKIVKMLLERGGNPNLLEGEGVTSLCMAVSDDRIDIVKILLKFGAKVNVKGMVDYLKPKVIAKKKNLKEISLLLENAK